MSIREGGQQSALVLSGLLPNQTASVSRVLNQEKMKLAEERIEQLISSIQPNQAAEHFRNAVADYVQRLITKCFSCRVFTVGSVPLKTYLSDGDIDLTVFSDDPTFINTWATEVQNILEQEEKSEKAEFHVKEVQCIQAEVKIIKCLVENIVVDISFNQLGSLCALCFLEEVDWWINQNHILKRSILLIKAWCFYESHILGAQFGLISTYALETLVLYIFHVYNNTFTGPLEVLCCFLEFFSKFDWSNFCISLWGPVPICSLPNMTAYPPRNDGKQLLLSKIFLDMCTRYAVFPGQRENQELSFAAKYFNIIDPVCRNNNLGRSVGKGNFFRICSAFAFGAEKLFRVLDCPREHLLSEIDQFFKNTWGRHVKGYHPDASYPICFGLRSIKLNHIDGSKNFDNYTGGKKEKWDSTTNACRPEVNRDAYISTGVSFKYGYRTVKQTSQPGSISEVYANPGQKIQAKLTGHIASDHNHQMLRFITSHDHPWSGKYLGNVMYSCYHFANTCGILQPMDTSHEVPTRGRLNKASEKGKSQIASTRSDNWKNLNMGSSVFEHHYSRSSIEDSLTSRHGSSFSSDGSNGPTHMPMNLISCHPAIIRPPLGYAKRDPESMVPVNVSCFDYPQQLNQHCAKGVLASQVSLYIPRMKKHNQEEESEFGGNLVHTESSQEDGDNGFCSQTEVDSIQRFDCNGRRFHVCLQEGREQFTSFGSKGMHSSHICSSCYSVRDHEIATKDGGLIINGGNYSDNAQCQRTGKANANSSFSLGSLSPSEATSLGIKPSSPYYFDGPHMKTKTLRKYQWRKKSSVSTDSSIGYRADKNGLQCEGKSVGDISFQAASNNGQERVPHSAIKIDPEPTRISVRNTSSRVSSLQHRFDILNGDFTSYWQNLQYGWLCQNFQHNGLFFYPSSHLQPRYVHEHFPHTHGRPPENMNCLCWHMINGDCIIPVSPLQHDSSGTCDGYLPYDDNISRYHGDTETLLPNPVSLRDLQYSNTRNRRGKSWYKKDYHFERERDLKTWFSGRCQIHNPTMRMEKNTANDCNSNQQQNLIFGSIEPVHLQNALKASRCVDDARRF